MTTNRGEPDHTDPNWVAGCRYGLLYAVGIIEESGVDDWIARQDMVKELYLELVEREGKGGDAA